ncbi:hypothetical protein [Aurantimonas endophytica]|uniref:Uncharacterized protein n=1 Tax=Aurantimonas endophytica TaxID=1522175 RepID=A0A7W6HAJ9_9HYPH|nr:hypothetical protein [Aurantimonas endophytica]MBB4001616.1 hypothetical protein [Aurantimonas endophytica]MCO6402746.1 hypothetical protein [Aurantimonas endophytica]
MIAPLTSSANDPVPAETATPADGEATLRPGSVFISQNEVRFALDGGFSVDEVAFMLDLRVPSPEGTINGESHVQSQKEPPPR